MSAIVIPAAVMKEKRQERERLRRERDALAGCILSLLEEEQDPPCSPAFPAFAHHKETLR